MQQLFARNRNIYNSFVRLFAGLCIVSSSNSASADSIIKQAEIYQIRNQVDISYKESDWTEAIVGDTIVPQDSVRTGANSRADILFNEGTLVRTGQGTIFRFPPGKRSFELTSGAALIMIRPEQGQSTINTPEAKIVSEGTALFVQHDPQTNASLIGVLTNSPAGLVKVSDADGEVTLQLQAGQFVSVVRGVVGLVEHFVLPMFYETVELSAGLGLESEETEAIIARESAEVQATIEAVRAEAIDPLQNQLAWLEGFCQLDVETEISPLLQLLGVGVSGIKVNFEVSETDLPVVPFRSLGGVAWLNEYCQGNTDLPKSKIDE